MVQYKLIFQDIDGVLNNSFIHHGIWHVLSALLAGFTKKTGAYVVLSTQWRLSKESREEIQKEFLRQGIPVFLSCTPLLKGIDFRKKRLREIMGWLRYNTTNVFQEEEPGVPTRSEFLEVGSQFVESDFMLPRRITVSNYIIFDDIDLASEKYGGKYHYRVTEKHFVKTLPRTGLSENNIREALYLMDGVGDTMKCDFCQAEGAKVTHHKKCNKYFCAGISDQEKCSDRFFEVEIPYHLGPTG